MKYIVFILFPAIFFSQTTELKIVKDKFSTDSIAYNQFLDLGKCLCLDKLTTLNKSIQKNKKFSFFDSHFYTLYDMNYPLARMFVKDSIQNELNKYYKYHINKVLYKLKERDEKLKLNYHSPYLFCEKLFENSSLTHEMYQNLISNNSSYNNYYFKEYIND